jgi:hypothetical protein
MVFCAARYTTYMLLQLILSAVVHRGRRAHRPPLAGLCCNLLGYILSMTRSSSEGCHAMSCNAKVVRQSEVECGDFDKVTR